MRLFWALPLPDSLKRSVKEVQRNLKSSGLDARWTDPENLHLTLVFLGEVDPGFLGAIQKTGAAVSAEVPPMELRTAGLGAFPRPSAARVLWWGLEANRNLEYLAHRLGEVMGSFAKIEERPFTAHLTLARFREPAKIPRLGTPSSVTWTAGELVLFQSRLGAATRYEAMTAMPLRAADPIG